MKYLFNLQLFAEEGATGGTVDAGASVSSSTDTSGAGFSTGGDTADQIATGEESFDDLIAGRFKDDFNAKVQGIVKKRIKDTKGLESRVNQFGPLMEAYGARYGIDPSDEQAIINKLLSEDSLYEDKAIQMGTSVDYVRQLETAQRENALLKRQQQEAELGIANERKFNDLQQQAAQLKAMYPSFDLDKEMENERFANLVWNQGFPIKDIYELYHKDEIMASGMQYAVQQTQQKITNSIRSNGMRPSEGGTHKQAAASFSGSSPKEWTKEQRAAIREKVRRGERVVLD